MKITIDTKEDSHEDIKKVVALLSQLLTTNENTLTNVFDNPSSEVPNIMNLFELQKNVSSTPPNQITENSLPKKDIPKIELY